MSKRSADLKLEIANVEKLLVDLEKDLENARLAGSDPSAVHSRIFRAETNLDKLRKELETIEALDQTSDDIDYQTVVRKSLSLSGGSVLRESLYSKRPKTTLQEEALVRVDSLEKRIFDRLGSTPIKKNKYNIDCIDIQDFYTVLNSL